MCYAGEVFPLAFLDAVFKFDVKPFFFDDFVVGAAVKDVGVAIDFVAFAHGYGAGEFFGKEFADGDDICFGDVFAHASVCRTVAEADAYAVSDFADIKDVIVVSEFGVLHGR